MPNVPADLAEQLRAGARGWHPTEAAVEFLIGYGHWLQRDDFVDACITRDRHFLHGHPIAHVDWEAVAGFLDHTASSSSAAQVLRIATELAGVDTGHSLSGLLLGLDDHNTRLVCDAVAYHNGLHEHGGPK